MDDINLGSYTLWDEDYLEGLFSDIKQAVKEAWKKNHIPDIDIEITFFPEDKDEN